MKKGFTLIEIIVTMTLISIIVVLTTSIISGNYISILKTGSELDSYYAAQEKLNTLIVNERVMDDDGNVVRVRDLWAEKDPTVSILTSNPVIAEKEGYYLDTELTKNVIIYNDGVTDITENMNLLMIKVSYTDMDNNENIVFGYVME